MGTGAGQKLCEQDGDGIRWPRSQRRLRPTKQRNPFGETPLVERIPTSRRRAGRSQQELNEAERDGASRYAASTNTSTSFGRTDIVEDTQGKKLSPMEGQIDGVHSRTDSLRRMAPNVSQLLDTSVLEQHPNVLGGPDRHHTVRSYLHRFERISGLGNDIRLANQERLMRSEVADFMRSYCRVIRS
jgi:hypothetical protein